MNKLMSKKLIHKGFSIIECLIAILIATTLIWQVAEIYKNVHRTHQLQNALSKSLHHAMWFDDVMGQQIKTAGLGQCTKDKNSQLIMAFSNNNIPVAWSIHPARNTEILQLSHCVVSPMGINKQVVKSMYYLKKNINNQLYTLYKKQQDKKAVALQDDIKQLNWYLAFQTKKSGQLTAPQAVGSSSNQAVGAVSWKVIFSNANHLLANHKNLTRTFYGYMGVGS